MRSFKKIAAMIMAVAMLCSFTALANAVVELADITAPNSDNPTVTLGYADTTTATQRTMLVYKGTALEGADVVYINQFAEDADAVELNLEGSETATYTVVAGGMDVAEADTKTFDYTALGYNVTLTKSANGFVETEGADLSETAVVVNKGTTIKLTLLPHVGYIPTVTVNDAPVGVSDTNEVSITVDGDKAIAVTFVEAEATAEYQSFSGSEIHTIAGNPNAEDKAEKYDSKLMFGKAIAPAGETITEAGMYLKKWNGTNWEEYVEPRTVKYGPYFKADNTVGGKYGIRFIRFNAGKYQVRSYVKYGDGQYAYGKPVEFEVE